MFKLLRYYSAASLVAVLAAVVLLTWFYRQVAIQGIVQLAERSNVNLAEIAMNPIKPELLAFLDTASDLRRGKASPPLPPGLARSIKDLMQDRSVVKIKIYNRQGVVAFSTKPAEIGNEQTHNEGVIAALRGGVGNELVYRDTFNSLDGVTEKDNLMQTYLPVRASPAEPVQGVFELYADVNSLVQQTERTEFIIMAGALLIMSALYAVLLLVVRHANKIIESQQRTITERNETLALLADHMLKTEESDKQKIAFELHEGVAQTLAALKLQVEGQRDHKAADSAGESANPVIPMLQEAIEEVRAIATDLRPASLDDLGLLPTIFSLCREFEERHPSLRIEPHLSLQEKDIPPPLKGILYRSIVSVLGEMVQDTESNRIQLTLALDDDVLTLLIEDESSGGLGGIGAPSADHKAQLHPGFARMEELTTLSGGAFTATDRSDGGTTLRAVWNR